MKSFSSKPQHRNRPQAVQIKMLSAVFLTFLFLCLLPALPAKPTMIDGIAATVNGRVITRSELKSVAAAQEKMIRTIFHNEPAAKKQKLTELREKALENLIDRELILTEFNKQGGVMKEHYIEEDIAQIVREQFDGNRDQFLKELSKTGISPRRFREMREKMLVVQFMRQSNTGKVAPPSPDEVSAYYQKNIRKYTGKQFINLSTISLSKVNSDGSPSATTKQLSKQLRKKVQQGADFAELARTYSEDSMADKGGSWGWVEPRDLSLGLSAVAFALPEKQVSEVLDNSGRYIIMYINKRKPGKVTPLSKVAPEIEKRLRQEKGREMQDIWLNGLRRDAMIRKY